MLVTLDMLYQLALYQGWLTGPPVFALGSRDGDPVTFDKTADFGTTPPIPADRQVKPVWDLENQVRYTVTVRRVVNKPDWEFTFTGRLTKGGGGSATNLVFQADHGVKVEIKRHQIIDVTDPEEIAA